jgi:hypothetical protein
MFLSCFCCSSFFDDQRNNPFLNFHKQLEYFMIKLINFDDHSVVLMSFG